MRDAVPTKPTIKPLRWIGSSYKDFMEFPRGIVRAVGYALLYAQTGRKHDDAKALKGFGDAAVLEIIEQDQSGTYRAVYTIRFAEVVYVLHAFQKKSRKGIQTPKEEIATVKRRLNAAEADYKSERR